jgi:hypothetical protein
MEPPFFPVPFGVMKAEFDFVVADPKKRSIGSVEVIPIRSSHPNGGYGFKFIEEGKTFVFIPDNELDFQHKGGLTKEAYVEFSKGADLLMHDAQYTDEEYPSTIGWGHTKLSSVIELGVRAGVGRLALFHHDPAHTDDDMDGLVAGCREGIERANSQVECFAAKEDMEITL